MYSQYETTVMNRRRLHDLLSWVNRKYYLEYEVVQENKDVFYVLFHDLNGAVRTSIQNRVRGTTKPAH